MDQDLADLLHAALALEGADGARLHRALLSLEQEPSERCLHSLSRLGIWARGLADGMEAGTVSPQAAIEQLRLLGRGGEYAFARWQESDVGGQQDVRGADAYHWGNDPYWTTALQAFGRRRESGVDSIALDLEAIEQVAFVGDGPAYRLMEAMVSVKRHEGCEGFKGAPRLMLALIQKLDEVAINAAGRSRSLADDDTHDL